MSQDLAFQIADLLVSSGVQAINHSDDQSG
jgi:hypothetical protein